jgi:hypothetical protein
MKTKRFTRISGMNRTIVMLSLAVLVGGGGLLQAGGDKGGSGLVRRVIPDEDPGPPYYARVGFQVFDDGQWVAIPFYRPPSCIPADFNLLQFFHFPGPDGPGAFACPLLVSGFLLIEPDASLGTFPRRVVLEGRDVPVWFVPSAVFADAIANGGLTIGELEQLQPMRGLASSYHETLHPRPDEHLIVIVARGTLEDGRTFVFQVTHLQDEVKSLQIALSAE